MGPMACPHCGRPVAVFPDVPVSRSIRTLGIEPLGSIPFDPSLGVAGDTGQALVVDGAGGEPARAFRALAETLVRTLG
jgi:Flp pilus assembly CpaE family ATPase